MALNPGIDAKEAAAIERRRRLEEERKERIFNPKARRIGVDVAALDEQVRMKREREEEEARRERLYEQQAQKAARELALLEQQQADMAREQRLEQERFRLQQQQFATRKEFDLNDPDALKKDKPADSVESVSAGQKFLGEDRGAKERAARQKEQMRIWTEEQLAMKEYQRRQEEEAERLYQLRQLELNQRQKEMEDAAIATRKAIAAADKAYNERLNEERREKARREKMAELNDNLEEINNNLNSDLLNENPAVGRSSALGPNRVVPYDYKGMSREEIQQIRQDQLRQVEEAKARRAAEEEQERRWALQTEANRRMGVLAETEQERARRLNRMKVEENNSRLAEDYARKQSKWNTEANTNVPTDAYWGKFGTSTR